MARRSPQVSTGPSWGALHALGERRAASRGPYPARGLVGGAPARRTRVPYAPATPDVRERWRTSFIEATSYDWAIEHEHVAGVLGRLIWGTDTSVFYRDIARLGALQDP
jgi:hypothetical protein